MLNDMFVWIVNIIFMYENVYMFVCKNTNDLYHMHE